MSEDTNGTKDTQTGTDGGAGETQEASTWETWLAGQPEDQRAVIAGLYETQTSGLRSALDKERDQRRAFEKQLKDVGSKLEEGSEARQAIEKMTADLQAANQRADFYEEAAKPEIGLADPAAAWLIVQANGDTFYRRGRVDWEALKAAHPVLFRSATPTPRGNAGTGTTTTPSGSADMNTYIRAAAGRAPQ